MLKGAKLRSQLFDILGVRVILTNRQPHEIVSSMSSSSGGGSSDGDVGSSGDGSSSSSSGGGFGVGYTSTATIDIGDIKRSQSEQGNFHSPSTAAAAAVVGTPSTPIDVEKISVHRVYTLISELSKWAEDKTRFKDYVSYPKPSG